MPSPTSAHSWGVSAEYAFRTWLSAFVEYDCDGFWHSHRHLQHARRHRAPLHNHRVKECGQSRFESALVARSEVLTSLCHVNWAADLLYWHSADTLITPTSVR